VLIALAIAALILTGLGSTLHAVFTSEKAVKDSAARGRLAGIVLERLGREIASTLDTKDSPLVGFDHDHADTISFWTAAYGAPRRIHYFWNKSRLERIEENPLSRETPRRIAIPGIDALNLRYHDGKEWRESWSEAELPKGVALAITIQGSEDGTIVTVRP
jgi:hypothetical protein